MTDFRPIAPDGQQPGVPTLGKTSRSPAAPNQTGEGLPQAFYQMFVDSLLTQLPIPGVSSGMATADSSLSTNPATSLGGSGAPTEWLSALAGAPNLLAALLSSQSTELLSKPSSSRSVTDTPTVEGAPADMQTAIEQAAQRYGVPAPMIESVMQQESGMDPQSVSSAGAMGLMQLMPATAVSLGVDNPFDPVQNINGGTQYLAQLLHTFHNNVPLALAAYNAGPGAVQQYNGIPPFPETQNYVQSVLAMMRQRGMDV